MEKCYVCNSCGKCNDQESGVLLLACRTCGHIIEPGENTKCCSECGGTDIALTDIREQRAS